MEEEKQKLDGFCEQSLKNVSLKSFCFVVCNSFVIILCRQ